jgi:hypothetical protein
MAIYILNMVNYWRHDMNITAMVQKVKEANEEYYEDFKSDFNDREVLPPGVYSYHLPASATTSLGRAIADFQMRLEKEKAEVHAVAKVLSLGCNKYKRITM